ncbi:beta-ketoacyl synthase N-terminal-like domain-containing protein [Sorangium sp. So ce1153]|uniref:type I polyketide synthase n=1 Tax=Sorangium sp. So ce1153 TaxID=3133333 RepID=UPI003F632DE9
MADGESRAEGRGEAVAIIGMACRVPGADDVDAFWQKLRSGVESITFSADGAAPAPEGGGRRVGARGLLRGAELFDAAFFGVSPAEAAVIDPQHRVFLECAWEALERAGYDPARHGGSIGIYAGAGPSGYLLHHVAPRTPGGGRDVAAMLGNDKDHLTTRVAYKLGLKGPAITVQTACSTSLVAVQLAWQALLGYQCDLALAGGVSIGFPLDVGYAYQEGFILSPDGHCRAFDARAQGTVPGDGAGVVVLKRLSEALADGDHIHAVLLGAAVNNDGGAKVGYTAPSVEGQAQVIAMAHAVAQVDAGSIGYVEAHGTGTRLGDPIEIAALTLAFLESTERRGFCAVGSVKTNVGHLNTAAGVASLIKAALAVEHGEIPPSLHFSEPNPEMDIERSPFFVNAALRPWDTDGPASPRRAGVSSFGFGGTNAHVILEEAPAAPPPAPSPSHQLLVLSARSAAALDAATANLRAFLARRPDLDLADVAYTLQVGRRAFHHRRVVVCSDAESAVAALEMPWPALSTARAGDTEPEVVFMLPGQGAQHPGMARALLDAQPTFRRHFDEIAAAFAPHLGRHLGELLDPAAGSELQRTDLAQPALCAVEYALARLWMDWGVRPRALIGHSLGEYVAACLSGVLSLDHLALLVAARGRLMQELPEGAMLAVTLPEAELARHLDGQLAVASVNAPALCVASGPRPAVDALEARLAAAGVPARRLAVARAFHSPAVEPILSRFHEQVRRVRLGRPSIPYLSNLTGAWITEAEARSPAYWVEHLRSTVRFAEGLAEAAAPPGRLLLEVGPGRTLSAAAARLRPGEAAPAAIASLGRPGDPDLASLLDAAGRLWLASVPIAWDRLHEPGGRRRVPLPTYPFERERHFIDAPGPASPAGEGDAVAAERRHLAAMEEAIRASLAIRPIEGYPGLQPAIDALCASHVVRYLRDSGVDLREGAAVRRGELLARLGVLPKFERLHAAMLRILAEDGLIRQERDEIRFTGRAAEVPAPAALRADLEVRYPGFTGIYRFLEHCATSYPDALTGRIEAIGVLFPGGSSAFVDECERATVEHRSERIYIGLLCEAAARIAAAAQGRPLRVLEVGGGRGLLTWPLVEALAGHDVEYHFTDLGRVFVDDARAEAARRGVDQRMRFGVLDIARDPRTQGHEEQRFDLVVAFNVVHATRDVGEAIDNLARLLAPEGTMALVETVRVRRWDTLTWGLAEGWWYFQDEHRRASPLLALGAWEELIARRGFDRVEGYPRAEEWRARADHGLILARRQRTGCMQLAGARRPPVALARPAGLPAPPGPAAPLHRRPEEVATPYVAPRSELERRIAAIVGPLLGVERVGVRDDFFQLGADSLIMLRITDRVRQELGREVPPHAAFRGATVERMASALDGAEGAAGVAEDRDASLAVPLQPRGTKRPLFFVHPAAGVVFPYVELSRLLGPDRPFYGLQARGLDGMEPPDTTIEAMARHYVAAMRRVQPEGPYHLGGFSFGGLVAFETAQQLVRAGHRVELLAMLDEPAPVHGHRPSPLLMAKLLSTGVARSIWPHLHDYFYLARNARGPRERGGPWLDLQALLRASPDGGLFEAFLARSTMANYVPRESMLLALRQPAMLPMFRLFMIHLRETIAYVPRAYPGRVTLFKATRLGGRYERDPTWGWGLLAAGGVDVHAIPGEHLTVVRQPHVVVVADLLRACLEEADLRAAGAAR